MTEQEQINERLQRQIDAQTARIDNVLTKVDMLVTESQQQREDIRRAQEKHDADMKEMRADIKSSLKHIQNLTIAAMVGIGAITAATWAFMWSTSQNNTYQQLPSQPPAQYQHTEQPAR